MRYYDTAIRGFFRIQKFPGGLVRLTNIILTPMYLPNGVNGVTIKRRNLGLCVSQGIFFFHKDSTHKVLQKLPRLNQLLYLMLRGWFLWQWLEVNDL